MDYSLRHRLRPGKSSRLSTADLFEDVANRRRITFILSEKSWLLILLFYCGVFCLVFYCDVVRFPTPLSIADLQNIQNKPRSHLFSEERARTFVADLSNIGPKPTGSYENEVLAVDYILRQLNHIKANVKPYNILEIDLQKTTGCFPLRFIDGMTSCYKNVKNIVAKIGPLRSSNSSLLVNCHFDSVPTSPGASDDIVSCAIMLEILLALSQHDEPLHHSVVFLFNGAEENILQAAHGFITQHKWSKDVVGFVNLEACGAGGKQMMFQADKKRTWLVESYANGAAYPHGSVVAQEIFQSGLIPSDTDFRIFEHFGGLPGLDFAFVKNGYVYHTRHDTIQFINPGSIQQAGDNILHLIHQSLLSSAMQKSINQQTKQLVYFDLLGIFMVVYSTNLATVLDIILVVVTIADMGFKMKNMETFGITFVYQMKVIGKVMLTFLASLFVTIAANVFIALFLGFTKHTMAWYRTTELIAGLYGCVSVAVIIATHLYFQTSNMKTARENWYYEDIYFDASRLLWIILLLAMQLTSLNSSFICSTWILFPTFIRGMADHIFHFIGLRGSVKSHLTCHLMMHVIPLIVLFYCMWSIYSVFIPIMGRIGANLNPDIPIAVFTALLAFFSSTYMTSLIHVTRSLRNVLFVLLSVATTSLLLICLTPIGFPYSNDLSSPAPMRCYLLHTERNFHNKSSIKDSGYWVVPLDYNGPHMLTPYIDGLKNAPTIDCDGELGCGMPFYLPIVSLLKKSYYTPAPKPKIHRQRKFGLVSHEIIGEQLHRLSFKVTGPDHMTIFLSPFEEIKLVEWSLYIGTPLPVSAYNNRQSYFIYYCYGDYTEPWEFSIVLKVPKSHVKGATVIDVSFITHHLHGHDAVTGNFSALLNTLPLWIHATPWTCTLDMYTF